MLQRFDLTSLDLPELAPYRTMRGQREHRAQGFFIAEGGKVVQRLLESELTIRSMLLPERLVVELEPLLRDRPEDVTVYVAPKEELEKLTGYNLYQGALALAQIPAQRTLDSVLRAGPRPRLLAAIEGLANPENIGVLVRNCAAFGVHALITGETCASPWLRRAVRSSMGTIFNVPVVETASLLNTMRELRSNGIRCVAAHPRSERRTLAHSDFTQDCCLVFGNEGNGLSPAMLAACDDAVAVPMAGGVDSLNVGSASAVFLYEAARQRGLV